MAAINKNAPSAVVGLDIGSESIKVSEARVTKDGIVITGLGIAQTPLGLIEDEVVVDPAALGAVIKKLLADSGIKTKKCVSAIEGQNKVVVRVIEVPMMEDKELESSMKWEVERQVPFAVSNEIEMDFAVIPTEESDVDNPTMEVLMAVAQKDVVDSHVNSLKAAGLKPYAIDLGQLATERALVETQAEGDDAAAADSVVSIISVGARNTEMGVYDNGVLTFPCPPIPIAGDTLTVEIAEALGVTFEEAENFKKEYACIDLTAVSAAEDSDEPTTFDFGLPGSAFDTEHDQEDIAQPAAEPYSQEDTGATFDLGAELGFNSFEEEPVVESEEPSETSADVNDLFDGFDLGEESSLALSVDSEEMDQDEVGQTAWEPDFDTSDLEVTMQTAYSSEPAEGKDEEMVAKVSSALTNVVFDLVNEIRRSIEYYSIKYNTSPTKIYLCGGTAKIPNLAELMSNELGIPVIVANPLENLPYQIPDVTESQIQELAPMFSESIGLAIRDMIV